MIGCFHKDRGERTTTSKQVYPSYFLQGCPPEDASTEVLQIYRMCIGAHPASVDFVSFYQSNSEKFKDNPNAYGLSVLKSRKACQSAYRKIPRMRRYASVAVGTTNEERGCWKNTPSKRLPEHLTWWVCEGVNPLDFFETDCILDGNEE